MISAVTPMEYINVKLDARGDIKKAEFLMSVLTTMVSKENTK